MGLHLLGQGALWGLDRWLGQRSPWVPTHVSPPLPSPEEGPQPCPRSPSTPLVLL